MSNEQASGASPSPSAPAAQGTSPLRIVLFTILGLLIVALAYDFLWARKQHRGAADRIRQLMAAPSGDKTIASAEPITQDKVLEVVGFEPMATEQQPLYYMERFSWRSGLPWRTHDLYVVYTTDNPRLLHDLSVGREPEDHQFPQPPRIAPPGSLSVGKASDKTAERKQTDQAAAADSSGETADETEDEDGADDEDADEDEGEDEDGADDEDADEDEDEDADEGETE